MLKTTVRYFIFSQDLWEADDLDPIEETTEHEFIDFDGYITYERHTISQNGVSQICLTKYPEGF